VETTLSGWVLLALVLHARVLAQPTRLGCFLAGAAIGAALMTKLTAATILLWPGLYFLAQTLRRGRPGGPNLAGLLAWSGGIFLVAGPWYLRYLDVILTHGAYAARFDQVGLGVPNVEFRGLRLPHGFVVSFGWIECLIVAAIGLAWLVRRPRPPESATVPERDLFARLSAGAIVIHAVVLMLPSYYEPRFFAPLVPTIAVLAACLLARVLEGRTTASRPLLAGGLLLFACGVSTLVGAMRSTRILAETYPRWDDTASLLDDLARTYHVAHVANVGQDRRWNVPQLLMYARTKPSSRKLNIEEAANYGRIVGWEETLSSDAIVVLQPDAIEQTFLSAAPSQDSGYWAILAKLPPPNFVEFPLRGRGWVLPDIKVYVKRSLVAGANPR
jgi:hypothetical protein